MVRGRVLRAGKDHDHGCEAIDRRGRVGAGRSGKNQLRERLEWGEAWTDSGLVFTREDGTAIHPERFTSWFEQMSRDAALPKIWLHDLRHSYATAALTAGIPAKVVSERLGHASVGITLDTYSHVLPARIFSLDSQRRSVVNEATSCSTK